MPLRQGTQDGHRGRAHHPANITGEIQAVALLERGSEARAPRPVAYCGVGAKGQHNEIVLPADRQRDHPFAEYFPYFGEVARALL